MRWATTPILLIAVAAGQAAELKIRDIRLTGGAIGGSDAPEGRDYLGTTSVPVTYADSSAAEMNIGPRGGVALFESFGTLGRAGGLVLGLSFSHYEQESDEVAHSSAFSPTPANYRGPIERYVNVFDVHIGYAVAIGRHVHLELMPYAGYGSMRVQDTLDFGGGVSRSDHGTSDGPYWEFGARVGLFYTFANQVQLGVDAGWVISHGRASVSYSDGSLVYEIDASAPVANISLGYRF